MKENSRRIGCLFVLIGLLSLSTIGSAQVSIDDFSLALSALPLTSEDRILAAIGAGLSQDRFPAARMLQLTQQIVTIPGSVEEKEGILILIARTIEEGLPADGMIEKGFALAAALGEGLPIKAIIQETLKWFTQRAPLSSIEYGISRRLLLLRAVRDLLFEKEIFSLPPGAPQTVPTALPEPRFNELLLQISDEVGDYLDGGGSPFEGEVLRTQVINRLTRLRGEVILGSDVTLIRDNITASDLTRVALAALSQPTE